MKHTIVKTVIALALTVILLVPTYFILLNASTQSAEDEAMRRAYTRLAAFEPMLVTVFEERDNLAVAYETDQTWDFALDLYSLREYVVDDQYTGPMSFDDGFILKEEKGKAVYPEGWNAEILPLPENFSDVHFNVYTYYSEGSGEVGGLVMCIRLAENTVAAKKVTKEELLAYIESLMDMDATIIALQSIYNGRLLLLMDDGTHFDDERGFFPKDVTAESLGLDFSGEPERIRTCTLNGTSWRYVYQDIEGEGCRMVFFYQPEPLRRTAAVGSLIVVVALAIIAVAMITWHAETQRMVRDKILTKEMGKRYQPARIRRATMTLCLICTATVFLGTFLYDRLSDMQTETTDAANALESIEARFSINSDRNTALQTRETDTMIGFTEKIAALLYETPSLRTRERLHEMTEGLKCEYVMVFDGDGNEILCDADYVGFSLGNSERDEMYPFRRLLKGVKSWVAEPAVDTVTGQTLQKIGVRMPLEGSDRFGAVVMAVKPEAMMRVDLRANTGLMLQLITPKEAACFAVSRETGMITRASREEMEKTPASNFGVTQHLMRENDTCGIVINGETWYGASRVVGDEIWFYCVDGKYLQQGSMLFPLLSTLAALIFLTILSSVLLWGYTQKAYDYYSTIGEEVVRGQIVEVVTADGRVKDSIDPSQRWGAIRYRWKEMIPDQKAGLIFRMCLLIVGLCAFATTLRIQGTDSSLLGFIMSGHWDKGFNLFSVTATVLMGGTAMLLVLVLQMILELISLALGTKGETILRLIINLVKYVALIMVLFYGLQNFGIDTTALLGAMAFLSLAVSLGARDLVSDILAGVTIVFEGDYQVGDIVEIGGYRGKVMEIGARSTKLMGQGDNVKIISNRDVRNVLNMTRFNSWYAMELNISTNYPLEKLENLLQKELPLIGQQTKQIISGPLYKGIEAIGKGSVRICILTECREDDCRQVQRQLNREIRLLLDREEVPMM